MKQVKHLELTDDLTVGSLVSKMKKIGVLGAGNIGNATELVTEMFKDSDYTVFLTLAGPVVPGGMRQIIKDLIEQEYVNAIVTTGANMVHDIVEALGEKHWVGTF
ncbi:deoxyhypusine synthase family protein, partial [Candidatus Bathyarchaeota archaeon]|nr:deoxyhypusine synthase family protein [Candidatus Bathyarchaeota archaeon]